MTSISAQRMNFLKQGKFVINYGSMGIALAGLCCLLGIWYGVGFLRISFAERRVIAEQARLETLNAEKEKRLSYIQLAGKHQLAKSAQMELASIFARPPHWSWMVKDVAKRLPHQLLLTEIKAEKDPNGESRRLTLVGKGASAQAATVFVMHLKDSHYLRNVELVRTEQSQEASRDFIFHVQAELALEKL